MVKTLKNPRYFNLAYQILIIAVFAQQIYFPQDYKYAHLALVFIRMILSEVYETNQRYQKYEAGFIAAIVVTMGVSVIEGLLSINLGIVYLLGLAVSIVIMSTFVKTIIDDSKCKQNARKFHPKHMEMISKNKTFTNGLMYVLMGICGVALLNVSFELIFLLQ